MIIQAAASLLSDVPSYAEGWENDFIIPSQYSDDTMAALRNKRIGDKYRHEILRDSAGNMLAHYQYLQVSNWKRTKHRCCQINTKISSTTRHQFYFWSCT